MSDLNTSPRGKQERYANYDNSCSNLMVDQVASPDDEVQFSMFETPSSQMVEDNRNKFAQSGFSNGVFEEAYSISETFDKLR